MKNRILVMILLLSITFLKSQININYTIKKIPGTREHILNIDLINNTSDKYVIPIDTTGFRVYYPDELCSNFYYEFADRGLGVMLMFKEGDQYVMGESRSHTLRDTDVNNVMLEEAKRNNRRVQKNIENWQKKYKIKLLAKKTCIYIVI